MKDLNKIFDDYVAPATLASMLAAFNVLAWAAVFFLVRAFW